jgi:hypothetical protein
MKLEECLVYESLPLLLLDAPTWDARTNDWLSAIWFLTENLSVKSCRCRVRWIKTV